MTNDQKSLIKNWWHNHSQDYKDEYKDEYKGLDLNALNNDQFIKYIDDIDQAFARKAYFAQNRNKQLFSNLITKSNLKNKFM